MSLKIKKEKKERYSWSNLNSEFPLLALEMYFSCERYFNPFKVPAWKRHVLNTPVNLLIMLNTNTANSYTNANNNTGNNTIPIITLTMLIIWQSGSARVIQPETKASPKE